MLKRLFLGLTVGLVLVAALLMHIQVRAQVSQAAAPSCLCDRHQDTFAQTQRENTPPNFAFSWLADKDLNALGVTWCLFNGIYNSATEPLPVELPELNLEGIVPSQDDISDTYGGIADVKDVNALLHYGTRNHSIPVKGYVDSSRAANETIQEPLKVASVSIEPFVSQPISQTKSLSIPSLGSNSKSATNVDFAVVSKEESRSAMSRQILNLAPILTTVKRHVFLDGISGKSTPIKLALTSTVEPKGSDFSYSYVVRIEGAQRYNISLTWESLIDSEAKTTGMVLRDWTESRSCVHLTAAVECKFNFTSTNGPTLNSQGIIIYTSHPVTTVGKAWAPAYVPSFTPKK